MSTVGVPMPQLDAVSKVTGQAEYCGDIFLRRALCGAVLRSPHAHARIVRVDTARAEKLPGVVGVVTAAATPGKKYGKCLVDEYLLAMDKVRYIGDEVAAVAAVDQETAEEALQLIEVVYEKLPEMMETADALRPGAALIHEDCPGNIATQYVIERGDIAAGFAESACVVEGTYYLPHVNTCYLEPTTCLASLEESGKLTVWAPTASPFLTRNMIASVLNLPPSKVKVIKPVVGGGFGARHLPKNALIAALLAVRTKRPIRMEASRSDEFTMARPRVPATIKLRMGFAKNGAILAKETGIVADNGAYTDSAPRLLETMAQRVDSLYRIANLRTEVRLVYTNRVPTGAFRGYGNPQMHFALESLLDMAAHTLAIDPLVLRRTNATQKGDTTAHGWNMSSCALTECIDKVRQEAAWDEKRAAWGNEKGQKRRGIGMACMIHVAGRRSVHGFWGATAWVKVLGTGKVIVITGDADLGQGCNTVFAQIAAEELGIPLAAIEIAPLDTDTCPYAPGTYSDRVSILGGGAVRLAALDVKRQLCQLAAEYFSVPESRIVYDCGRVSVQGADTLGSPEEAISIFALVRHFDVSRGQLPVLGAATNLPADVVFRDEKMYGNNAVAYTFAAQAAEVEVDMDTGRVKVLNFTCAHDLGRAINPLAAEGQVEGAVAQGIGYALTEEVSFAKGQIINANFLEYKVPTACETVLPKVMLVESNEPHGPYGAKGVGEPGLVPTAPAIANAIYHATGLRIASLPITPDKILAALEEQGRRAAT